MAGRPGRTPVYPSRGLGAQGALRHFGKGAYTGVRVRVKDPPTPRKTSSVGLLALYDE